MTIDFTPEAGPNYDVLGRVVTVNVPGAEILASEHGVEWALRGATTIGLSFGNGYHGVLWLDPGNGQDAQLFVQVARLDDTGKFVDGDYAVFDHTHFFTKLVDGYHDARINIEGHENIGYPFFKIVEPGKVLVVANIYVSSDEPGYGSQFRVVTTAMVVSYSGGSITVDFTETFDTYNNPMNLSETTFSSWLAQTKPITAAVAYKDGMLNRVVYRHGGSTEQRVIIVAQYIEYSNGVIVAHAPYIMHDSDDLPEVTADPSAWLGATSVEIDGKAFIFDAISTSTVHPMGYYINVCDENSLIAQLNVNDHISHTDLFNFWGAEELKIGRLKNGNIIVAKIDVRYYPYVWDVIEVAYDGTNLSVVSSTSAEMSRWLCGFIEYEDTVGFYGQNWGNESVSGQEAIDYHEQFGLPNHDESDVFTITITDVTSATPEGVVARDYEIPFSWHYDYGYRLVQEHPFTHSYLENGMLISIGLVDPTAVFSWEAGDVSGLSGWTMPLITDDVVPSLRLIQRDDDNEFGSSRIERVQVSSAQKSGRIPGPNAYW